MFPSFSKWTPQEAETYSETERYIEEMNIAAGQPPMLGSLTDASEDPPTTSKYATIHQLIFQAPEALPPQFTPLPTPPEVPLSEQEQKELLENVAENLGRIAEDSGVQTAQVEEAEEEYDFVSDMMAIQISNGDEEEDVDEEEYVKI